MTRRCVHLAGEHMTACGLIISGSLRTTRRMSDVLPDWRCRACVRATEARMVVEALRAAMEMQALEADAQLELFADEQAG